MYVKIYPLLKTKAEYNKLDSLYAKKINELDLLVDKISLNDNLKVNIENENIKYSQLEKEIAYLELVLIEYELSQALKNFRRYYKKAITDNDPVKVIDELIQFETKKTKREREKIYKIHETIREIENKLISESLSRLIKTSSRAKRLSYIKSFFPFASDEIAFKKLFEDGKELE